MKNINLRKVIGVGVISLIVIVFVAVAAAKNGLLPYVMIGSPAPDFELKTISGDTVTLSQYQGQPVILTLGSSWCQYCRKHAPEFQTIYERYPEVQVLFVNVDGESAEIMRQFADELGLTYPIALDTNGIVTRSYGPFIPNTFFLDRQGVVKAHYLSGFSEQQMANSLRAIGVNP